MASPTVQPQAQPQTQKVTRVPTPPNPDDVKFIVFYDVIKQNKTIFVSTDKAQSSAKAKEVGGFVRIRSVKVKK